LGVPIAAQTVTDGSSYTISGVREGIYNFRAVIGYDTIDAWFQAVGGAIYSASAPNYNQPSVFSILYPAVFVSNHYVLTDTTRYLDISANEQNINSIGNGALSSVETVVNNGGQSVDELIKSILPETSRAPIVNRSACNPDCKVYLQNLLEITDQNNYASATVIDHLNSGGGFQLKTISPNTSKYRFNYPGGINEDVTLNQFNPGNNSKGIVAIYVEGNDLEIYNNLAKNDLHSTNVVFVVPGDLTIHENVSEIQASFIVLGDVNIPYSMNQLTVNGSIISLGNLNLNRDGLNGPTQNRRPVDTYIFQPNLYFNAYPDNFRQTMIYVSNID
ncbi:hypothetical protein COV24_04405, partial [candidate division WWE3 bacterium CG10_big_fil_rev_8_21_14_0_10_32_10]